MTDSDLLNSKTQASEDFFDWLCECPINWVRIDENGKNDHYAFHEELENE